MPKSKRWCEYGTCSSIDKSKPVMVVIADRKMRKRFCSIKHAALWLKFMCDTKQDVLPYGKRS